MTTYTTGELLEAVGLPEPSFKALVQRGHFVPSRGRHGTGKSLQHVRMDVLQAAFLAALSRAGVPPNRASRLWRLVDANEVPPKLAVLIRDGQARLVPHDEVPASAEAISLRDLMREVGNRLYQIDARRAATDPAAYPFRSAFAAPDPNAAWSIFLADEAGEPDAETVARICDAIEAGSHILVAARSQAALECVVAVAHRMLSAAAPVPVH